MTATIGDEAAAPSPPARRALSVGAGFGVVAAALGFAMGSAPLADNSFFTHLATGRLILDTGAVPGADPYSWTAPDEPWVVQSWLASVIYASAERAGDAWGLRLLGGVLGAALAVALWRLTSSGRTVVSRLVVLAPAIAVLSTFWSLRPLLFGLLLLALLRIAADEEGWPVWVAAPVFALWVNLHGSWVLGFVLLGALAVGRRLDGGDPGRLVRLGAWGAGGAAVFGVLNPVGPSLLTFPVEVLGRSEALASIVEWQTPSFAETWARIYLVQVLLAIVALLRRPRWEDAVPTMLFFAASLLAARNVAVASLVLVPVTAHGLRGLGRLRTDRRDALGPVLAALGVVLFVVAVVQARGRDDLELATYPVEAVQAAERLGLLEGRVAHHATIGNYLELVYGTEVPVMMDDRVDMFPGAVVEEYLRLAGGRPGWRELLDDARVDTVIWGATSPVASLLREVPEWEAAYEDEEFVVFCRAGSPSCVTALAGGP